jgi:DNA-binding LacI/PurR family transcriptional regulator
VLQPIDRLRRTAAALLTQRVAGALVESQTLQCELVVRASCGCETPLTTREVVQ